MTTLISDLVRMPGFWNSLHQIRPKPNDWKPKTLDVLGTGITKFLNRIPKFG